MFLEQNKYNVSNVSVFFLFLLNNVIIVRIHDYEFARLYTSYFY